MPVVPPWPCTCAVYTPAGSDCNNAASAEPTGRANALSWLKTGASVGFQPLLAAITVPPTLKSWSWACGSTPLKP